MGTPRLWLCFGISTGTGTGEIQLVRVIPVIAVLDPNGSVLRREKREAILCAFPMKQERDERVKRMSLVVDVCMSVAISLAHLQVRSLQFDGQEAARAAENAREAEATVGCY